MKKTRLLPIAAISLMISLVGCNWQIPENVSVKTNAEYEFSAGEFNKSLDDVLDIKKMMENGSTPLPANVKVYDYFPGREDPNTQRYLIKVPLAEIPLDLNSILDQINLTDNLQAMEFNKDFSIPNISIPEVTKNILPEGTSKGSVLPGLIPSSIDVEVSLADVLLNTGVLEATVKEGNITAELTGVNSGATCKITNVVCTHEKGTGITLQENSYSEMNINLGNATIKPGKSNIKITLSLSNITDIDSPKIKVKSVITGFSSVSINLGEGVQTNFTKEVALPQEMTKVVSNIDMKPSGFKISYTNTLPAENKIKLEVNSKFLSLTKAVEFDKVSGSADVLSNGGEIVILDSSKVDFTANLKLNDAHLNNIITIKNIESGKTYNIGMSLKPVIDWNSVTVNPNALNDFSYKGEFDLGIDLNKMLTDLGTKFGNSNLFTSFTFGEIPVYLFCGSEGTDAFNGLGFTANASLCGTSFITAKEIKLGGKLPTLNNSTVVVDKLSRDSKIANLSDAINTAIKTSGNLKINYEVTAKGTNGANITIENKKQDAIKIALEAYIDLGLALNVPVTDGISIDLAKIEGLKNMVNKDILQGQGKTIKDQGIDAYLKIIKEISVNSNLSSLPYASEQPIVFNMKSNVGDWNINIGQGQDLNIKLTKEQIDKIFNDSTKNANCEFKISEMKVTLPSGKFSVPRTKGVGANLSVKLVTDGSIDLMTNGQPAFGGTK